MNDYKEYLDSLSVEEREYIAKFFKRKEYLDNINQTAIGTCNENVVMGKGNCNSKIAVIAEHYEDLESVTKFIKPMFDSINTSLWNIYITCEIKANDGNPTTWNQMIQHELYAVSPSFVFKFSKNEQSFIKKDVVFFNKTLPVVYINIDDVNYVLDKNNFKTEKYIQVLNNFYAYVLELIQYREVEIAE